MRIFGIEIPDATIAALAAARAAAVPAPLRQRVDAAPSRQPATVASSPRTLAPVRPVVGSVPRAAPQPAVAGPATVDPAHVAYAPARPVGALPAPAQPLPARTAERIAPASRAVRGGGPSVRIVERGATLPAAVGLPGLTALVSR